MIKWKSGIDVLELLARTGFTAYRLRQEKIIGQSELQRIRAGGLPSWKTLEWICNALYCNVGDLIEFIRDGEKKAPEKDG